MINGILLPRVRKLKLTWMVKGATLKKIKYGPIAMESTYFKKTMEKEAASFMLR